MRGTEGSQGRRCGSPKGQEEQQGVGSKPVQETEWREESSRAAGSGVQKVLAWEEEGWRWRSGGCWLIRSRNKGTRRQDVTESWPRHGGDLGAWILDCSPPPPTLKGWVMMDCDSYFTALPLWREAVSQVSLKPGRKQTRYRLP